MVITKQMVAVFFRFLNFALLLGVVLYVFKKYLLPDLKKQLIGFVSYLDGLRRSHRALQNDVLVVERVMKNDALQQERLKEYVKQWQCTVEEQRTDLVLERDERKEALAKRFEKHREQIVFYSSYKWLVPEVVDQVRADLKKRFAHEAKQQQFISAMTRDLPKR